MILNGVPFLVNFSQKKGLFTLESYFICTAAQLSSYLTKVVKLYAEGGFSIRTVFIDQEFDKVLEKDPAVDINAVAAMEHSGK